MLEAIRNWFSHLSLSTHTAPEIAAKPVPHKVVEGANEGPTTVGAAPTPTIAANDTDTPGHRTTDHKIMSHPLAEHLVDMVARIGPDFRYRYVSAACNRLMGRTPQELIGQNVFEFVHPDDRAYVQAFAQSPDRLSNEQSGVVYRIVRPDASVVWVETVARVLGQDDPQFANEHLVVHRDVSARVALEQQLREYANRDGLTNLANRRAFDTALEREWARMLEDASAISLLLIDVDHFKSFNDLYGHQVGDDCLRAVALAITTTLERSSDLAARYGGEEIAVILPQVDSAGALQVAEKLRLAVEHLGIPHAGNEGVSNSVSISVGAATTIAVAGGTVMMPQGLLIAADTALYKAKHGGRNRVSCTVLLAPNTTTP